MDTEKQNPYLVTSQNQPLILPQVGASRGNFQPEKHNTLNSRSHSQLPIRGFGKNAKDSPDPQPQPISLYKIHDMPQIFPGVNESSITIDTDIKSATVKKNKTTSLYKVKAEQTAASLRATLKQ